MLSLALVVLVSLEHRVRVVEPLRPRGLLYASFDLLQEVLVVALVPFAVVVLRLVFVVRLVLVFVELDLLLVFLDLW